MKVSIYPILLWVPSFSTTTNVPAFPDSRDGPDLPGGGGSTDPSFDGAAQTHEVARALRENAPGLPVALFPGSAMQLTDQVDLVLFLSLVSGRNAQYLIEEHVRAVPFLQRHPVATLSTAYILIDGGRVTSVEAVSQTRPLPADRGPSIVPERPGAASAARTDSVSNHSLIRSATGIGGQRSIR